MKFDKILTTGRVWVTSDPHYNHKNICRGVTNWRTQDGDVPDEVLTKMRERFEIKL